MEGPSRRERSECRDSDVHGAGVYWWIGIFKFAGARLYCGSARATPPRYGIGAFWSCSYEFCTESVRFRAPLGFRVLFFPYIYLIDVNLLLSSE